MADNTVPLWRRLLTPVVLLASHPVGLVGVVLVTTATILWLFLLPTLLSGSPASGYLGIAMFVILPMGFFAGLMLIPASGWLRIRAAKRRGEDPHKKIVLSLQTPEVKRLLTFLGLATFVNLAIGGHLAYSTVGYMESVEFCGATCHTVMKPEFTAYQNSPHSRVECVKCHIGPGASWFVKSKLSGSWQVIAVTLDIFPRPIPTPVENLRPARETCEACHWPDKYGADRLRVIRKWSDEGAETKTVLLMRLGGGGLGAGKGIHGAHIGPGIEIRYAHSDRTRQTIPWVEYRKNGEAREFKATAAKAEDVAKMEVRQMDCVDCHNRPSHAYELPERALDHALAEGRISADLPMVKKTALEIIKADYKTTDEAERLIPEAFHKYYRERQPAAYASRKADVDRSALAVLAAFSRNVFPEMKVKWGAYPNNIGHTDFPGCFRCHDDDHKTKDGAKAITQDCNTCHQLLAMDEAAPKVLDDLGVGSK